MFKKVQLEIYENVVLKQRQETNISTIGLNMKYQEVKNEYLGLINSFKENEKDIFIGGMPVQLEKDCMSQLLRTNDEGSFVYLLTLKVDGERFLLFLGSDTREIEFDVFNIGTSDHIKVIDFVNQIFSEIDWKPKQLDLQLDKPVGVASRASDNTKIKEVFGWEPTVSIKEGVARTIAWYKNSGLLPKNLTELEQRLMAR
jgi:hypothetical protein